MIFSCVTLLCRCVFLRNSTPGHNSSQSSRNFTEPSRQESPFCDNTSSCATPSRCIKSHKVTAVQTSCQDRLADKHLHYEAHVLKSIDWFPYLRSESCVFFHLISQFPVPFELMFSSLAFPFWPPRFWDPFSTFQPSFSGLLRSRFSAPLQALGASLQDGLMAEPSPPVGCDPKSVAFPGGGDPLLR